MTDVTGGLVALLGLMFGYAAVAASAAVMPKAFSGIFPRRNRHVSA
jgi:hypothetical protein